ncbi:MAG: DUF4912 domain-containing protein [Candidatus Omnitrophota bacterium]|jgi:hypothetical protein
MSVKMTSAGRLGRQRRRERASSPSTGNVVIPSSYNVTQVTLIVRDPYWIFAYWDVSSDSLEEARRELGGGFDKSSFVLRLYDVSAVNFNGANANQSFDIEVGRQATNWYVNLWCDNVSYCAEIGLRQPNGHFYVLARSNAVTTPRASFSGREDVMWMERTDSNVSPPFQMQDPWAARKPGTAARKDVVPPGPKKGRWSRRYLTEKDIRAYYMRLSPLLRKSRRKKNIARPGKPDVASSSAPSLVSSARDLLGYDRKYGWAGEKHLGRYLQKEFLAKFRTGSSAELFSPSSSENFLGRTGEGASDRTAPNPRKFFFELGTELIVYGRTEPDAQVFWGNKNIKLREDGTFSLRMALPDATTIPLDFTAESADKVEKRSIVTAGIRVKTKYHP